MKVEKMTLFIAALFVALIISGCGNYEELKFDVKGQFGNRDVIEAIGFEQVSDSIFKASCTQCHGNYTNYDAVVADLESITIQVRRDLMPKGGAPLTNDQKQILFSWIADGAPRLASDGNGGNGPTRPNPSPNPDPMPSPVVGFTEVKEQIFENSCTSCHSPYSDYNNVKAHLNRIAQAVRTDRMPLGGSLTPRQKGLLFKWISDGAPFEAGGSPTPRPTPDPVPKLEANYQSIRNNGLPQK